MPLSVEFKTKADLAEMPIQQWLEDIPNLPNSKVLLEAFHIVMIPCILFQREIIHSYIPS